MNNSNGCCKKIVKWCDVGNTQRDVWVKPNPRHPHEYRTTFLKTQAKSEWSQVWPRVCPTH